MPGLMLRVQPSGVKSFIVQWGRGKRTTIGRYPVMTVEHARTQAQDLLNDSSKYGVSPAARMKSVTFNDFIDLHYAPWVEAERKAGKATVANLRAQFGDLFGMRPLADISTLVVEKFKATRLKGDLDAEVKPVKAATVNRDLDRLRAALNKAIEWKMLSVSPLGTIKRSKGGDSTRVRWLKADEEKRLRDALLARELHRRLRRDTGNTWATARRRPPRPVWADDQYTDHLMPLVLLALNTGLRRGELLALTWENVDIDRRQLRVAGSTAKSGRDRHVPLNAESRAVVERLKKYGTGTGLVFPGADGSAMTHVKRSWAGLLEDAKISDFHFHDCRHHFASKLAMAGVDLYAVKELLGHSDFAMTQRYAHLSQEHKAAAVEKLVAAK